MKRLTPWLLLLLQGLLEDLRRVWDEMIHPWKVLDEEMRWAESRGWV